MDKIVSLKNYRRQKSSRRGFKEWKPLVSPSMCLDENTTWSDLPDDLILILCEDKAESRLLIYHLIMGTLDMGSGYEFETLPPDQLLSLLDIYFMVVDIVRFECMRRLGWIEGIHYVDEPIIDLILNMVKGNRPGFIQIRRLSRAHPGYDQDIESGGLDRQTLVRKYMKQAIQIFKEKVHGKIHSS